MTFWRKVLAVAWKDALSEMRTREIVFSVLVFTLLVIVIFNFAFGADVELMSAVAPGLLWVTFTFAGVLSLTRTFVAEKEDGCLEGLMTCPVSRDVIYAGKALGSLLFLLVVEVMALPVFALLFNLPVLSLAMLAITLLATIGFVSVGTLFSALAVNTRAREMVLPVLFLPIIVPVLISAVNASSLVMTGATLADISRWLTIIGVFDVIFLTASLLVFTYIIED